MLRERCDLAHALILFFFLCFFFKKTLLKKNPTKKKREVYTLYGTHYTRWPNKGTPTKDETKKVGAIYSMSQKRVTNVACFNSFDFWSMPFLTLTTESQISCGIIWRWHITPRCLTRNTLRKGFFFFPTPVSLIKYLNSMGSS